MSEAVPQKDAQQKKEMIEPDKKSLAQ